MSEAFYERVADLLEADLGDELMALDVDAGSCFGFNSVATEVWRHLKTPKSFDQLKEALLNDYDVNGEQCSSELRDLLDSLAGMGLVRKKPA